MATPVNNRTVFFYLFVLAITILPIIIATVVDEEFEGSRTLTLEHSFTSASGDSFSKRGTIVIQSLKGNKAQFAEASPVSADDRINLKAAAKNGGLYRVRIPVKNAADDVDSYVSSATAACNILESSLNDVITVSFDQSGEVLGVSIHGNVPACAGIAVPASNLTSWNTGVEITTTLSGPVPDTQTYIDKMKRDEQAKSNNKDGESQSFLGKYWMYILPFVIMMVVMSSSDPGQQGGGGGGGGR